MTSIPFSIGLGNSEKTSSKVLKPPGGGCSGIFDSALPAPKAQPAPPPAPKEQPATAPPPVPKEQPVTSSAPPPVPKEQPATASAIPPAASAPPSAVVPTADLQNSAPVAAGLRSERQKLFGPAETSSEVHKQSYNYRNQSSIVFGGVNSTATEPGKAATTHQPCVRIHNPPGGKSSGIF